MQVRRYLWLTLPIAGLAYACGGNSSSNGGDSGSSDTTTSSGGSGSGGSGSGSGSGGTASDTMSTSGSGDGGSGGSSSSASTSSSGGVGGAGGTAGASAGGSGGSGGSDGVGGSGAAGGSAGSGGTDGSSGAGGTAGSEPIGAIGVLGEPCDSPGELACAGNHQKLTVVCGGDGEWEVNQTCNGEQFCDTREGANQGTCADPDPACAGHEPGYRLCSSENFNAVLECGPDLLDTRVVETCGNVCSDGVCDDEADPCPGGSGLIANCSNDCGGMFNCVPGSCPRSFEVTATLQVSGYIRLPSTPPESEADGDACAHCQSNVATVTLQFPASSGDGYLMEFPEPWVQDEETCETRTCVNTTFSTQAGATAWEAPAKNVLVRKVSAGVGCEAP